MTAAASLSVVVVTPRDFAHVRLAVRHLQAQDAADEIELVLVARSAAAVADAREDELAGFASVRVVEAGPIPNVDRAAARGVQAASAEIVAIVEDHAYVRPGWARAVIEAYRGQPWVSVGSVMENANPRSGLSWANLLLGYGWWIDPDKAGEMHDVPGHNGSYRRDALLGFRESLPDLLVRADGLHDRLRAAGGRMFLAAEARIAHVNPSLLSSTARLRFLAGRLYGCDRRTREGWSLPKRIGYAAAAPLVRLRRMRAEHPLKARVLPGLAVALALDAAGQAAGYLSGPGRAADMRAVFEMDRVQHLNARDRKRLAAPPPPAPRPLPRDGPLPEVSVVIPAFRRADRLRACLAALAAQDYPADRFEVVVVDDGSPAPLEPSAREFADRLRVRVHRQPNAGPAVARNTGAQLASGALLAFTDDDCEPEPGWVRGLAVAHLDHPTAMLGGAIVNALPEQTCAEASQLLVSFLYEWYDDDRPNRFFASNNMAVPRERFTAMDGFDISFPRPGGEDRELCERWRRAGGEMVGVPAAVVRHSHAMGLRGFCRQHWNYGRGAHDLHRRRMAAGADPLRLEPPKFYLKLVTYPVGRSPARRTVPLMASMVVSQAATAVGFGWESRQGRPAAPSALMAPPSGECRGPSSRGRREPGLDHVRHLTSGD